LLASRAQLRFTRQEQVEPILSHAARCGVPVAILFVLQGLEKRSRGAANWHDFTHKFCERTFKVLFL
jgi:hypothetical protein